MEWKVFEIWTNPIASRDFLYLRIYLRFRSTKSEYLCAADGIVLNAEFGCQSGPSIKSLSSDLVSTAFKILFRGDDHPADRLSGAAKPSKPFSITDDARITP